MDRLRRHRVDIGRFGHVLPDDQTIEVYLASDLAERRKQAREEVAWQLNTWGREEWANEPDDDWDNLDEASRDLYRERADRILAICFGEES